MPSSYYRVALLVAMCAVPALAQEDSPEATGVDGSAPAVTPPPAPALEKPTEDPGKVLFQHAAETLGRAQSIRYHVKSYTTGTLFKRTARTVQADASQCRVPGGILPGWRLRLTGSTTQPGQGGEGPTEEFDIAWLMLNVEWVDHEAKKVIEKPFQESKRVRPYNLSNPARLEDLTSYRPFQKELGATAYTVESQQEQGGVTCDVILVETNQGKNKARWWLGAEDHLPRKIERFIEGPGGTSSSIVEFTDVRVDYTAPSPNALAALRVSVPEGYAEDRVPQPVPVPGAGTPGGLLGGGVGPDGGKEVPTIERPAAHIPPPPPPVPAGPPQAPAFDLMTPSGAHVALDSLRGQVVLLEFAGSWSVNLRLSRPELASFLTQHGGKPVQAFTLAVREKSKESAVEGHHPPAPALGLLLNAEQTAVAFGAATFPCYAVVGPNGELLVAPTTYKAEETFHAINDAVEKALAKMPIPPK
ncbi:hypothetical protein PHYC_02904 [Phycisphaerales bacterium]|nr:hypothetical protein PHYC_02904 [Phycisphaerales bacterium]